MKRKVYVKQMNQIKTTNSSSDHHILKNVEESSEVSPGMRSTISGSKIGVEEHTNNLTPSISVLPNVGVLMKGSLSKQSSNFINDSSLSNGAKTLSISLEEKEDDDTEQSTLAVKVDRKGIAIQSVDNILFEKSLKDDRHPGYDEPPSYTFLSKVQEGTPKHHQRVNHDISYGTPDNERNYVIVPCGGDSLQPNRLPQYIESNPETLEFGQRGHFQNTTVSYQYSLGHHDVLRRTFRDLKSDDKTENGHSIVSPETYSYQGNTRIWEQENSRYVNYAWESNDIDHYDKSNNNGMYTHNNLQYSSSADEDPESPSDVHDSYFYKMSSGPSRRRRKRVQTPVQRTAANMRERRRMCHLNVAFDHLKEHLPNIKDKKKLSRIQTLKAAICYIHLLRDSLEMY